MDKVGKTAVVHYVGTLDDGTVFDTSRNIEPLEFVIGARRVISGFEEAVSTMEPGEKKTVVIPPEQAYGAHDEDKVEPTPMYAIPGVQNLEIGKTFYFQTHDGLSVPAKITSVTEGIGQVDFNHPLAGQTLTFELELLEFK